MPKIGVSDLHYAAITSDGKEGTVYGQPKPIPQLSKIKIDPKVNSKTYYADNVAAATYSAMGEVDVEAEVGDVPIETQAELLGSQIDGGVMYCKSTDQGPYVALGFVSLDDKGKKEFVWLYKGKFSIPAEDLKTLEDTPDFQPKTIKGTFISRASDGLWRAVANEGATGYEAATGTNWFTKVHEKPAQVPEG